MNINLQASPINMDATGCEQAKEICCNVNVWSILVNVILQVCYHINWRPQNVKNMILKKTFFAIVWILCKLSICIFICLDDDIFVWIFLTTFGNLDKILMNIYHCLTLCTILQDAPFFVFRVILITYYRLISSMNIFCTMKNTLVIALQVKYFLQILNKYICKCYTNIFANIAHKYISKYYTSIFANTAQIYFQPIGSIKSICPQFYRLIVVQMDKYMHKYIATNWIFPPSSTGW